MTYVVSITSQGQISIPTKIRRELGLSKTSKAIVSVEKGKVILEPVKDFLELAGSLHHKAIKRKTIDEIIELEEEAIKEGFIEKFKKARKHA